MYRLLIDNEAVELKSNQKIQLNKLLIDLTDISLRGINYTNSFTLPFTQKNDRLTGFPSRLSSDNLSFETRKTYVLSDSSTILSRGNVIVESFDDKDGIKIQLAEGSSFWNVAGSKLMQDLSLHANDFEFTTTNMDALKVKTPSVFLTALHSATDAATGTALTNYNATRPCYRFDILLGKIIEELGYTVDYTNIFQKTDLLNLGCLSNAEKFYVSDFKRRFQNVSQLGNINYAPATTIFTRTGNVSQTGSSLNNATYETSYVIKGFVQSPINTQINLQVNGDTEVVNVPKGRSFINFRSDAIEIGSSFIINFPTTILLIDCYVYSAINEASIFKADSTLSVGGFLVLADYNLPKQTYKQFIKNIIKLNFLDFTINESKKEITFKYVPDIINTNNVVDFSKKVERYFEVKGGSIYGQISIFKYNNYSNINEDRGSAFINVVNENAPNVKDVLVIDEFSASQEITVSGNNILLVDIYTPSEFKRESVRDRIVLFKEEGAFGFNATFTGVTWQRLYSKHYVNFVQSTTRERMIEFSAFINNLDFRTLQRNPLIYVDFLQSIFLVTEISGFERGKKCKLKCIKYN